MANNKMKMIRILEILKESDEENPVTMSKIIEKLNMDGISAERKSIYDCIAVLKDNGYDINLCEDNKKGYYLGERNFEDWELKILIDSIWQAKFLNYNVRKSIADKIKSMASITGKKKLTSATPVRSSIKNSVPNIQYYIDRILKAIHKKKKIKIQYTEIDCNLKRKLKNDGMYYIINPYSLALIDSKYYLICNYDKYDDISSYRVDRITNLEILEDEPIKRVEDVVGDNADLKINEFIDRSLYQYGGQEVYLTMRCDKGMLDELFDKFGDNLRISNIDEENIEITVKISDGAGLYYWILQHEDNLEVISPKYIREKVKEKLENTLKLYK